MINQVLELDFPEWEVQDVEEADNAFFINARYTVMPKVCPNCSATDTLVRFGFAHQKIMGVPIRKKRVIYQVKRQRFRCNNCGQTFTANLPHVDVRHSMTDDLIRHIRQETFHLPFTSIAKKVGVDESTVRHVFDDWIEKNGL